MSNKKESDLVNLDSLKNYLDFSETTEKKMLDNLKRHLDTHKAPCIELLSNDDNLSNREKLEQSVNNLNALGAYLRDVAQVYNKTLKKKSGKYTEHYALILNLYKEKKSIYKCQEELKRQDINISLMQIYNVLVKYGAIEKK